MLIALAEGVLIAVEGVVKLLIYNIPARQAAPRRG
jgi:hypothetical protein